MYVYVYVYVWGEVWICIFEKQVMISSYGVKPCRTGCGDTLIIRYRGVIRSRTRPDWRPNKGRGTDRGPDWSKTGPRPDQTGQTWDRIGLDRSKAEKWHGLLVPPLFVRHGQPVLRGMAVPPILFGPPSFFFGHSQPMLRGTTMPPILFGLPIRSTGPDWDRTEVTRSDPVRSGTE